MSTEQLEKNIAFCIDECEMDDQQIGDMLGCIEKQKLASVEHFCEEFVFIPEDDSEWQRYHEKDYLNIAQFNAMYFANEDDDDSQLPNYGY